MKTYTLFLTFILSCLSTSVFALEWQSTELQMLYGRDYKLGEKHRTIMTVSHANEWKYGYNAFFFDVAQPFEPDADVYFEGYTWLSYEKMTGNQNRINFGIIDDVMLGAGITADAETPVHLYGLTLGLKIPHFDVFTLDLFAHDHSMHNEITYAITPYWSTDFNIKNMHLRFRGFVTFTGENGENARQISAQPQLLMDIGQYWGLDNKLFMGIEYLYYRNKYGVKGTTESMPQAMIMLEF